MKKIKSDGTSQGSVKKPLAYGPTPDSDNNVQNKAADVQEENNETGEEMQFQVEFVGGVEKGSSGITVDENGISVTGLGLGQ
ncbi:MAG TPA: hypothetical protein PLP05_10440 [Sedimentisphaerales bacterium]|nr:hypothetical protein [Sedimentisphaerales bacterium]